MLVQAQINLSFNPAEGETYLYRFNNELTSKQTTDMDIHTSTNSTSEILMEMNVKEKNKDEVSVDCSYKEIVMESNTKTNLIENSEGTDSIMNFKYDSKNTDENSSEQEKLFGQITNRLIGKTLNVIFTPDGSIKSISGFNTIIKDIQNNTDSINPDTKQALNGFLLSFGEDATKRMLEQVFYPDKEVKVGDNWDKNFSFKLSNAVIALKDEYENIKSTYTLKSVENGIASLDVVSSSNTNPYTSSDSDKESENFTMIEGSYGESKGEINLDVKTGMLINSIMTGYSNSVSAGSKSKTTIQQVHSL